MTNQGRCHPPGAEGRLTEESSSLRQEGLSSANSASGHKFPFPQNSVIFLQEQEASSYKTGVFSQSDRPREKGTHCSRCAPGTDGWACHPPANAQAGPLWRVSQPDTPALKTVERPPPGPFVGLIILGTPKGRLPSPGRSCRRRRGGSEQAPGPGPAAPSGGGQSASRGPGWGACRPPLPAPRCLPFTHPSPHCGHRTLATPTPPHHHAHITTAGTHALVAEWPCAHSRPPITAR